MGGKRTFASARPSVSFSPHISSSKEYARRPKADAHFLYDRWRVSESSRTLGELVDKADPLP